MMFNPRVSETSSRSSDCVGLLIHDTIVHLFRAMKFTLLKPLESQALTNISAGTL